MPEKKSTKKACETPSGKVDGSRADEGDERSAEEWFAGICAGLKGVSRKLLDQVPPEMRKKVAEKARSHGPGEAALVVSAAALKTRSLKAKLALKTLAGLLKLLDSKGAGKKVDPD